jgi:hypothetical protein
MLLEGRIYSGSRGFVVRKLNSARWQRGRISVLLLGMIFVEVSRVKSVVDEFAEEIRCVPRYRGNGYGFVANPGKKLTVVLLILEMAQPGFVVRIRPRSGQAGPGVIDRMRFL